jgi:hypothetical protein
MVLERVDLQEQQLHHNNNTFYQTCEKHVRVMNIAVDGAKSSYKTNSAAVGKSRDETFGMLSVVADSVGNKRKFLEDTMSA